MRSVLVLLGLTILSALVTDLFAVFAIEGVLYMAGQVSHAMRQLADQNRQISITILLHTTPVILVILFMYLLPILKFLAGKRKADVLVKRRALNYAYVIPLIIAAGWLYALVYDLFHYQYLDFSGIYIHYIIFYGTPISAAALTLIANYFLSDFIFRYYLSPLIFENGIETNIPGQWHLNIAAKLTALTVSLAFFPIFVISSLAILYHENAGQFKNAADILLLLRNNILIIFSGYIAVAIILISIVGGGMARPIRRLLTQAGRIRDGKPDLKIPVESNDEIGLLTETMNSAVDNLAEKNQILEQFGRVVDPSIRDYLLSAPSHLSGEKKTVTILFTDIRGFTAISESRKPEEVVKLLNLHFSLLTDLIKKENGHIDKFIGDSVMAIFGLFDENTDICIQKNARSAITVAKAIQNEMEQFNGILQKEGLPSLKVGVGIHTGEVFCGKIGSLSRYEYTVIGDTVNLASRCEALCKELSCDIVATAVTTAAAQASVTEDNASIVNIRGKSQPVKVYCL